MSGRIVQFAVAAVRWISRSQKVLSPFESGYISLAERVKEVSFLGSVFGFMSRRNEERTMTAFEDA